MASSSSLPGLKWIEAADTDPTVQMCKSSADHLRMKRQFQGLLRPAGADMQKTRRYDGFDEKSLFK